MCQIKAVAAPDEFRRTTSATVLNMAQEEWDIMVFATPKGPQGGGADVRTIKLTTNLLAAQTSRPLLKYDSSNAEKESYIEAAKRAFKRDYVPMTEIIRQA